MYQDFRSLFVMSANPSTPSMTIGKRKRTVVSYAEDDSYRGMLGESQDEAAPTLNQSSGNESDDNDRTWSTRKVGTTISLHLSVRSNPREETIEKEDQESEDSTFSEVAG